MYIDLKRTQRYSIFCPESGDPFQEAKEEEILTLRWGTIFRFMWKWFSHFCREWEGCQFIAMNYSWPACTEPRLRACVRACQETYMGAVHVTPLWKGEALDLRCGHLQYNTIHAFFYTTTPLLQKSAAKLIPQQKRAVRRPMKLPGRGDTHTHTRLVTRTCAHAPPPTTVRITIDRCLIELHSWQASAQKLQPWRGSIDRRCVAMLLGDSVDFRTCASEGVPTRSLPYSSERIWCAEANGRKLIRRGQKINTIASLQAFFTNTDMCRVWKKNERYHVLIWLQRFKKYTHHMGQSS